jgi:phosphinothricin acetyltransferase
MMIRHALESDLPAIVAIYNAAVPSRMATADLEPVSVESRLAWFQGRVPSQRPLWVVETEGVIAGWLSFQSAQFKIICLVRFSSLGEFTENC